MSAGGMYASHLVSGARVKCHTAFASCRLADWWLKRGHVSTASHLENGDSV